MTHKKANDFIKKWNKDLMIKNYSKLKIKEKMDLIEKRLKEIKSENISIMRSEWKGEKPKKKVMVNSSNFTLDNLNLAFLMATKSTKLGMPLDKDRSKFKVVKSVKKSTNVPKGSHLMPDGSIMRDSEMKKTRRKKLTNSKDDRIPKLVTKY